MLADENIKKGSTEEREFWNQVFPDIFETTKEKILKHKLQQEQKYKQVLLKTNKPVLEPYGNVCDENKYNELVDFAVEQMQDKKGISDDDYEEINNYLKKIADKHTNICNENRNEEYHKILRNYNNQLKHTVEGCSNEEFIKEQSRILSSNDNVNTQNINLNNHASEFKERCFGRIREQLVKEQEQKEQIREQRVKNKSRIREQLVKEQEQIREQRVKNQTSNFVGDDTICDTYLKTGHKQDNHAELYKQFEARECLKKINNNWT